MPRELKSTVEARPEQRKIAEGQGPCCAVCLVGEDGDGPLTALGTGIEIHPDRLSAVTR